MHSTGHYERYFSPLRYPGGKAKLFPFVKSLIAGNGLLGGEYVEPYAGGAGIGIELLAKGYVSRLHINDINRPLVAFW
jgi:DNA adenine methylase